MSGEVAESGANALQRWQLARLPELRALGVAQPQVAGVTALAYHFWDDARFDAQFDFLEAALRETWRHCGGLPTVLVVNRVTPRLEAFAAAAGGRVALDLCEGLIPGDLYSMSVDCNARLHRRFATDHVLVVQNDGFPLRPGLEAFVGRYDFIGAPYVRDTWLNRLVCGALNCRVSNGGFSLRSRRICELASHYWTRGGYGRWPKGRRVSEDIFYTETLPLRERAYRRAVTIADFSRAAAFSYDAAFPYAGACPPFGFHGVKAFEWLCGRGWVDGAAAGCAP